MAPIRVRAITQPTFTRYVFDLPELIGVSADNARDKLTLTFDAMLRFDLADAKATLPPVIESVDSEPDHDAVLVRFTFSARVDVRTFREDNSFVVDVEAAERKAARRDDSVRSDELSSMGAELSERANAPENATAPKPVPAPDGTPVVPEQRSELPPAEPPQPARAEPQPLPVQQPPSQQQAAAPAVPPAAEQPKPPTAPSHSAPPPAAEQKQSALPPVRSPQAAPASPRRDSAARETSPPGNAAGAVWAAAKRNGESLSITFPFAAPTPAAVFRRADTVWMVFDTTAAIAISALNAEQGKGIRSGLATRVRNVALVRVKLERPQLISVAADGNDWTVTLGNEVVEPTSPLLISRHIIAPARSSVTVAIDEARNLHRLEDPDVGDSLYVITADAPARGFLKSQDFVEFRALASAHGVALQPLADDLNAELSADKIVVSRPGGLSLSAAAARSNTQSQYQRQVLDLQSWGFDRQADFTERKMQLALAAADAPDSKRLPARCDPRASISPVICTPRRRRCSTSPSPTTRRRPRIPRRWCSAPSPIS
jgi:hypothetical protein